MNRILRRVVCTLLLATALCAQDAAMVLQRSVGYGTLKNSTTLTPEKRAEVEAIEAQTRAASAAGRYGEALKFMAKSHGRHPRPGVYAATRLGRRTGLQAGPRRP